MHTATACRAAAVLIGLCLAASTAAAGVNKSVRIEPGARSDGATSVNGNVTVGAGAIVTGNVRTVNGTVRVEDNAAIGDAVTVNGSLRVASGVTSRSLSTVNGSIRIDENVTVDGEVTAVNGRIGIARGSRVASDVRNVNGDITLDETDVGGNLETVSGDIELQNGAILRGDLIVEKPSRFGRGKPKKPEVIIGPGSKVLGKVRLERPVDLYISNSAEVGGVEGVMSIDNAVRFSGKRP